MRALPYPSPGEILLHEFLEPMALSAEQLVESLGLQGNEVLEVLRGRGRITPELAQGLSEIFGTSEGFWSGLQESYDKAN